MSLYLDNAATTKISTEVLNEMLNSIDDFGNSEAKFYEYAEKAKKNIKLARNRIALGIGCSPDEIIFTSGATEANNMFIKGIAFSNQHKKKIIISSIEHSSVKETSYFLKNFGYEIVEIPVNEKGLVDLDKLEVEIDDNTLFVSIIMVNNEIGTIQDIESINNICSRKKVILHMDATQAIGKINFNFSKYDSLKAITFTSHKIYGPKGIGALILKRDNGIKIKLTPLFHGGEQEDGYRAGTLSNELIVGFGKAIEIATNNIKYGNDILSKFECILLDKLKKKFGDIFSLNNDFKERVPGILNVKFKGINNMILLKKVSKFFSASTGSACSVSKPSYVLKAIGLSNEEINSSIRLSLSKYHKLEDFDVIDLL